MLNKKKIFDSFSISLILIAFILACIFFRYPFFEGKEENIGVLIAESILSFFVNILVLGVTGVIFYGIAKATMYFYLWLNDYNYKIHYDGSFEDFKRAIKTIKIHDEKYKKEKHEKGGELSFPKGTKIK